MTLLLKLRQIVRLNPHVSSDYIDAITEVEDPFMSIDVGQAYVGSSTLRSTLRSPEQKGRGQR